MCMTTLLVAFLNRVSWFISSLFLSLVPFGFVARSYPYYVLRHASPHPLFSYLFLLSVFLKYQSDLHLKVIFYCDGAGDENTEPLGVAPCDGGGLGAEFPLVTCHTSTPSMLSTKRKVQHAIIFVCVFRRAISPTIHRARSVPPIIFFAFDREF